MVINKKQYSVIILFKVEFSWLNCKILLVLYNY